MRAPYGSSHYWKYERMSQRELYPGQREALSRRAELIARMDHTPSREELGRVNAQIARAMGLSERTIISYLSGARVVLKTQTVDEAAEVAVQQGLIPFRRP